MMSRRLLVLVVLLLAPYVLGQFRDSGTGNLKVRIMYPDGRPCCEVPARVQLFESSGSTPVDNTFTNDSGVIHFLSVRIGDYHIIVSGQGIQETDSGVFEVDERKTSQSLEITVKRSGEAVAGRGSPSNTPTVSAADLNIPDSAKKEFDKANEFMAKQDWKKMIEQLNKALAIYPKYASAYNNLGVAYSRLGDRASEREALQKAVSLDEHFAPAYVNLARMEIVDHNFPNAETLLNKAVAGDPNNPQTLVLLANVELLDRHYDEAIANCRKVHSSPQNPHALVHYIAARALEHENRAAEAVGELQTFLQEEPLGDRADSVRKELAGLQNHVQ